jgi:hypothetical protein
MMKLISYRSDIIVLVIIAIILIASAGVAIWKFEEMKP